MFSRIKALFKRQQIETDMDKEMRFHVEMLMKDYEQAGMSSGDARAAALRKFGNLSQIKERGRDVRGAGLLEELRQDIAYGIRMLRRSPGFTIVALVALSLGIGVTTAIFSIANGLFFRSTPDSRNGALVRFYGVRDGGDGFDSFSYANYKDARDQARLFDGLAAHQYVPVSITAGGNESRELLSELVTGNYFSVLGINPKAGRVFLPDEDITTEPHLVTVLSERFVREEMASDAGVVGRRIFVNGTSFEVIGVVADSFKGTYSAVSTGMWFPLSAMDSVRPRGIALTNRGWGWLFGTGRLKPGVTIDQASQEISGIAQQLERDYPRVNRGLKFQLTEAGTLPDEFRANVSRFLLFFMSAAGAVLLITCANIASLTLARTTARRREVAIRQSLGAARFRLIRQWLTESVLLSMAGGICGAFIAVIFRSAILGFAPPEWMSFAPDVSFDWKVMGFTIGLVFMAGLLFGLAPSLQAGRAEVVSALKSDGTFSGGSRRPRFYGVVVAAQVTISLVLMIVSGLLFRSLQRSEAFHTGFDNDHLAVAEFDLRRNGYAPEARQGFYEQLVSNLRSTPNIVDITRASVVPLGEDRETSGYQIEGYTPLNGNTSVSIANDAVGADYFKTMGIPIIEGRAFDPNLPPGPPVEAVVNQAMAERFWPNQSAIGKRLGVDGNLTIRVVGVARTIPYYQIGETPRPYVYVSSSSAPAQLTVFVKTTGDPKQVLSGIRQVVRTLDPRISVDRIRTFAEVRRVPLFPARALLAVASGFGLLSLVLTLIGIYGVISYSVSRRTHEFGIRMALGAKRSLVFQMVIVEGLKLTIVGIAAGVLAAIMGTRFLSSLLFGVTATDPVTFGGISILMILTAAIACYVPARRATRVDPLIALRQDG
jgi:macrolide transport system ATP-binding/permease protein